MKNLLKKIFTKPETDVPGANEMFIWPEGTTKTGKEKSTGKSGLQVISNIHNPSLTFYLPSPETATGAALVIAPGGGHNELWIEHEGYNVAKKFSELGIASFVLKYRLSKEFGSAYSLHNHSLADMLQAIRFVRHHAKEWNIDPSKIGVMGFSAGGELAGLAAENFDEGNKNSTDQILQQSSYPNFQALIYPSSAKNFKPARNSPPLFLLAGENDKKIVEEITNLNAWYHAAGILSSIYIYANEGHGFGIRENNSAAIAQWPQLFVEWLVNIK